MTYMLILMILIHVKTLIKLLSSQYPTLVTSGVYRDSCNDFIKSNCSQVELSLLLTRAQGRTCEQYI